MNYHGHMKQCYDRLAHEYEQNAASREEPAEYLPGLLHAISLLPPARVLDVACGSGFFTHHLGSEVTGLDQSEAMLKLARGRVPWAGFVRGVPFGCLSRIAPSKGSSLPSSTVCSRSKTGG